MKELTTKRDALRNLVSLAPLFNPLMHNFPKWSDTL